MKTIVETIGFLLLVIFILAMTPEPTAAPLDLISAGEGQPVIIRYIRNARIGMPLQSVAVFRPMIAPDIFVQRDADSPNTHLAVGDVLQCREGGRRFNAIVEGNAATVSEVLLTCGEGQEKVVLVVKGILFNP